MNKSQLAFTFVVFLLYIFTLSQFIGSVNTRRKNVIILSNFSFSFGHVNCPIRKSSNTLFNIWGIKVEINV